MEAWLRFQQQVIFVARYAHQPRSEIRAMPLSTFRAWFLGVEDMIIREQAVD